MGVQLKHYRCLPRLSRKACQRDSDDDQEHHDTPSEIESNRSDPQRRNKSPKELDWRIRDGVDDLGQHEHKSLWTPLPLNRLHQVEDESTPHQEEIDQEKEVRDERDDADE